MLDAATRTARINIDRLWAAIAEMALIGPGVAGGCDRQTLTDTDSEARARFATWCEAEGMSIGVDDMGNMFALRPGTDPEADPVYLGSHLDTQPTGGRYDGVLGVLSALEVVRVMNEQDIRTSRPIGIVNWTNEEGARFAPSMLGSGVFAGAYTRAYAHSLTDQDGKTLGDELQRIGWMGAEPVGARPMHAYLEYHIEQGPVLEAEGKSVGVVTHCQGFSWLEITLTGREAHTGSTPMTMRSNAGLAMARIMEMVQDLAMQHQPDAVGSVGQVFFSPNSRNVLPGKVVFTVDVRSPDPAKLDMLHDAVEQRAKEIAAALGVGISIAPAGRVTPVTFDPALVAMVREAAQALGVSHMDLISGAGHDACWMAKVLPATMIMCPCVGGLSHNEAEEISPEWAEAGANVLLHTALSAAGAQL
ncbi:Zn-dependent hydrolase [Cribrihabitans neustonicus]|uniref:Zn-dependent hydrolase n=1 Tax=Cribrihabitans neustonicus TaxID=1429085 RepID=UPI003B5BABFE